MTVAPTLSIPSPAASLFHTATGTAFIDIEIKRHRETWPVRGKQLRAWLRRRYYEQTGEALPGETIRSMLDLLEARAQFGDHPTNAKSLKGFGSGVFEIRDNFDGDTYRAVYTVRFEGVLYVLHVFQKKSTRGTATPKRHLDLVRQRLRDAETIHRATERARL